MVMHFICMSKKIVINLRQELYSKLDKEAKKKLMNVDDLVYQLLLNHIKILKLRHKKPGRPKKPEFEEIFSRKKGGIK